MDPAPQISIVLATHNRREVVVDSLRYVHRCGLDRDQYEVIAVDNASTDGTPDAIAPHVNRVMRLSTNRGSCAKARGVDVARGRLILFLDDDSSPQPGSLARMIEHFEADPQLGAAGFRVMLPNGEEECGALPDVFVGCGVAFRAKALRAVGGLDRSFFMQAEEYDLAYRLVGGGWGVQVFDDLFVDHLKSLQSRRHERTTYFDTRNNLRVIARYLPSDAVSTYRQDALQRYEWIAGREGHEAAFQRGRRAARRWWWLDRFKYQNRRLGPRAFEQLFRWDEVRNRMRRLADVGARRVVFVELGKNLFPFQRAAQDLGVDIIAIGDDRFASPGRLYRGTPVRPIVDALSLDHDAVVISNMAPVFADRAAARARSLTDAPVHCWYGRSMSATSEFDSTTPPKTSDDTAERYAVSTVSAGS